MERAEIDGAWIVSPRVFGDERGYFLEWFRSAEVAEAIGYPPPTMQGNISLSRRGVVRGVHFSSVPPGQAKYVTCVSGAIFDVIVDVRTGSEAFGAWQGVRLDEENRRAVYLSEGLGHAFMAVSPHATVAYLCSTPYAPGREHGVNPLDPAIGIEWPTGPAPLLSEKDAAAPTLAQARAAGILPVYEDCRSYFDKTRARREMERGLTKADITSGTRVFM